MSAEIRPVVDIGLHQGLRINIQAVTHAHAQKILSFG